MAKKVTGRSNANSGKVSGRRRPKARLLPTFDLFRIEELDTCAALVSDIREDKNDLRQQENEQLEIALNLMRQHAKQTWRAHGVEFVRVPGEEKLRVRTSQVAASRGAEHGTHGGADERPRRKDA